MYETYAERRAGSYHLCISGFAFLSGEVNFREGDSDAEKFYRDDEGLCKYTETRILRNATAEF